MLHNNWQWAELGLWASPRPCLRSHKILCDISTQGFYPMVQKKRGPTQALHAHTSHDCSSSGIEIVLLFSVLPSFCTQTPPFTAVLHSAIARWHILVTECKVQWGVFPAVIPPVARMEEGPWDPEAWSRAPRWRMLIWGLFQSSRGPREIKNNT